MVKDLNFNIESWTTGCLALLVRITNSAAAAPHSANSARQSDENHPLCGACFKPISRLANANAISPTDTPSKFLNCESRDRPRGSRYGVAMAAMIPGGTLTRNSQ